MPFITIKVLEGKTKDQKRDIAKKMTDVMSESWDMPKERIYVFIEEMDKDNYGKAGELYSDRS